MNLATSVPPVTEKAPPAPPTLGVEVLVILTVPPLPVFKLKEPPAPEFVFALTFAPEVNVIPPPKRAAVVLSQATLNTNSCCTTSCITSRGWYAK